MYSLADRSDLVGFFSYSRDDDLDSMGTLSALRERIQAELAGQLGRSRTDFRLWQDKDAIPPGALWEGAIKTAVAQSVFFIPIVTPRTVRSAFCKFEFESFLAAQAALGRTDLVFPLLYIEVPALKDPARVRADPLLALIAQRQYVDWSDLRHHDVSSTTLREAVAGFCGKIAEALSRPDRAETERVEARQAAATQARLAEAAARQAEADRLAEDERRALEAARQEKQGREDAEASRLARETAAEEAARQAAAARQEEQQREAEAATRLAVEYAATEAREAEDQRRANDAANAPTVAATNPMPPRSEPAQAAATESPGAPVSVPAKPPRAFVGVGIGGGLLAVAVAVGAIYLNNRAPIPPAPHDTEVTDPARGAVAAPARSALAVTSVDADLASDDMVRIPSGRFTMGSTAAETSAAGVPEQFAVEERPQHVVTIKPFALAKYDVTFDDWDACVSDGGCGGYRPADQGWGRRKQPVINVSWADAQSYIAWVSRKRGHAYRLPTEAEWEYANRAGTTTAYYWGNVVGRNKANCDGCGSAWDNKQTAPVGSFAANPWGLYDISGNVDQWTSDCWNENYAGAPNDGSSWASGKCEWRVVRGGSWYSYPWGLRAAYRSPSGTDIRNVKVGFRLARTLP